MANDNEKRNRPEFNPRHRIAGAIILVSLAVIFVPMLLDDSTPPKSIPALAEIPARDPAEPEAKAGETKVIVVPAPAPDKTVAIAADPIPDKPAVDSAADSGGSEAKSAAKKSAAAAKLPAAAVRPVDKSGDAAGKAEPKIDHKPDHKLDGGWVVQVGTFSNNENAERLRDKLKSHGFAVNAESVTVHGGQAMRLRVGPFHDKSAATKAQLRLQKEINVQGVVLAYP